MKSRVIILVLCLHFISYINCDFEGNDAPDYDFNPELLFKAFRQNVTLPTRKPAKKPTTIQSPPKNSTLPTSVAKPVKKPTISQVPPKNTTIATTSGTKPSLSPAKPYLPLKNTTLTNITVEYVEEAVVSEQTTPVSAVSTGPTPVVTTPTYNSRCKCKNGECGCCTGSVLAAFNQKACLNLTYVPDDFAFTTMMIVNERVVYKNTFSGKNPPPICIRLPRIRAVKLCARFSNIYFSGPNMHTCIDFEADWEDISLFETSFDCIRFGAGGIGVLPPEEGGGANVIDEGDEDIEDYDDSAR